MLPGKGWLARLLLLFTNGRQRVIVDAMAFYTKYNTPRCTGTYVMGVHSGLAPLIA